LKAVAAEWQNTDVVFSCVKPSPWLWVEQENLIQQERK
jgi:hypothetical protein